jgi:hypothetical protein
LLQNELELYEQVHKESNLNFTNWEHFVRNNELKSYLLEQEKREEISAEVKRKLTGAKGQKVIVGFNNSKENSTEVIDIPLNDAPQHYEYLAKECFEKLVVGHRVTSPMLLGVRDSGGGFSNNADEIKTATLLYDNLVIKPYQLEIIEALDTILAVNNIKLKLYFKTIQPLEFTDLENAQTADQVAEETGTQLSAHTHPNLADALIDKGEVLSDEWHLIDETEVDYDSENELDLEIETLNNKNIKGNSKMSSNFDNHTALHVNPEKELKISKMEDYKEHSLKGSVVRSVYQSNSSIEQLV